MRTLALIACVLLGACSDREKPRRMVDPTAVGAVKAEANILAYAARQRTARGASVRQIGRPVAKALRGKVRAAAAESR